MSTLLVATPDFLYTPIAMVEQLLTLLFMWLGFSIMLRAVGVKTRPGRTLGRIIVGLVRGAWWLTKILFTTSFDLLEAIARGLPSPKTTASNSAYGTGKFLEGRDLRRLLGKTKKHDGFLIDGNALRLTSQESYMHIGCIAGSGKGKGVRFVIPNLLTLTNSLISLDLSGELYDVSGGYLATQGVQLMVLSVTDARGLRFNPLAYATTPGDLRQIAQTLVQTSYGDKRGDAFWTDGASNFLFLLLSMLMNEEPRFRHIGQIKRLVDAFASDGAPLNEFVNRNATDEIFNQYKSFIGQPEKTRLGHVATASVSVEAWSDPALCKLMSGKTTLDFSTLRRQRAALFIQVEEHKIAYYRGFLVLFFSALLDFAMTMPKPDEQSLFIFLDEFGNAGAIPNFSNYLTSLRKRRTAVAVVCQSESQISKVYGHEDSKTILSGLGSRLYLPGQDLASALALEKAFGRHGFVVEDDSGRRREVSKNLMNADEIMAMSANEGLLQHSNRRPVFLKKTVPFFKNRRLRKRSQIPPPPLPATDDGPVPYLTL